MSYTVELEKSVLKILKKWKRSNPDLLQKAQILFYELAEHPRTGTGHPEPLIGGEGKIFSRRISAHDRMVYRIEDEIVTVYVLEMGGHYDDK